MFHPRRFRLTSYLLLAAYLAANTVGGLFHQHGDVEHSGGRCEHVALDFDGHQHGIDHSTDGKSPHDDDCTVCRFAGLKTMPAAPVQLVALCDLSVELAVVHSRGPAATVARTLHSRAPPCMA
jgi:DUF2946 family protein